MIFKNFFRGKLQFFPTFFEGNFSAEFSLEKMYEKSAPGRKSSYPGAKLDRKGPGIDVMIKKISAIFANFMQTNWRFSQTPMF
jgi:hypothetical protein